MKDTVLNRNSEASVSVRNRAPFRNKNRTMLGYWVGSKNKRYVVLSYGVHFPMYIWEQGVWYKNVDRYSQTTTRHQRDADPGVHCARMTTGAMRRIMVDGVAGLAAIGPLGDDC